MHLKQTSQMEIMSKLKIPQILEIWFLWAKWIYDWLLQLSDYSQLSAYTVWLQLFKIIDEK